MSRRDFESVRGESFPGQPRPIRTFACIVIALLLCGFANPARAQAPPAPDDLEAIYQRLDEQEALIHQLREQLAESVSSRSEPPLFQTADSSAGEMEPLVPRGTHPEGHSIVPAAASASAPAKPAEKKKEDDWVDLSSEKWTVKLGGHVQGDFIEWADKTSTIPAQNYFEFRRLRLLADGVGYGVFDFRLQIDIEPEAEDNITSPVAVVKDAYFTMNEIPWLNRVRVGNFFVPFSLEQVTNDTNNIFMERSIPTQGVFAADREVGIAMYGVSEDMNKTWTFGTFIDSISEATKERIDNNQGQRVSGRVTWLPYYDEPSNGRYLVHTGAGVLYTNDHDDIVRFSARPQIHEGPRLIDSGNLDAGSYLTGNLEFAVVWGSFSVQSELFLSNVNLIGNESANLFGGYIYTSYFLTGESRVYERFGQHGAQFGRNAPISNFFLVPGGYGPGAIELKARTSYLDLQKLDKGRYNDLTVGANWYWTDRVRIMFDWIHPWTTEDTPYGKTQSDIIATRFDFNW